jgi:hypothetical protein
MTDVTRILSAIDKGDPHAAEQLMPLVYDELRRLAAQSLLRKSPVNRSTRPRWFMRHTCTWWATNSSPIAAISSPPLPKRCGAS